MFLKFRNYLLITTLKGSPNSGSSTTAVATSAGGKRKTSRRANTAERRATHNAVERQRRETLNGRFLDLAALLPNLASVRRPSKSAIVNSSIVQIHQARRTRLLAARELRLIRSEADALRRELNEWRARATNKVPSGDMPLRTIKVVIQHVVGELNTEPIIIDLHLTLSAR